MADIFISYRSLRQPAVRHLKRVLEAHGYTVWFDYGLLSGEEFAPVIERELREARAAIVVWCQHSKDSHWVREEADLALSLGNYLPVLLDPIDLPFGFRRLDTIDLSAWDGDPRGHTLDRLLEQISKKTGRDPAPQYKTLVELQQVWRDTGRIAWAALPLDEKLAAQIEEKRKAAKGLGQKAATPAGSAAPPDEGLDHLRAEAAPGPTLLTTLKGHGGWVFSAGFSPDGRSIVTASADKTARIWRAADGALLATLKGHGDWVRSAGFSPDGRSIVTASLDKTARIWALE